MKLIFRGGSELSTHRQPSRSKSSMPERKEAVLSSLWARSVLYFTGICQALAKHIRSTVEVLFTQQLRRITAKGKMYLTGTGQIPELSQAQPSNEPALTLQRAYPDTGMSLARAYDDYRTSLSIACLSTGLTLASHTDDYRESLRVVHQECTESVRIVHGKGAEKVLQRYWGFTKKVLNSYQRGTEYLQAIGKRVVGKVCFSSRSPLSSLSTDEWGSVQGDRMMLLNLNCLQTICSIVTHRLERLLAGIKSARGKALNRPSSISYKSPSYRLLPRTYSLPLIAKIKKPTAYSLLLIAFTVFQPIASAQQMPGHQGAPNGRVQQLGSAPRGEVRPAGIGTIEAGAGIKPLQVGDKVPEEFWTIEHSFLVENKVSKSSMARFRGKLLLLDFWEPYCYACIMKFPALDSIHSQIEGRGHVVLVNNKQYRRGTAEYIGQKLNEQRTQQRIELGMDMIIYDDILKDYFKHIYIPHYILIADDGTVLALGSVEVFDAIVKIVKDAVHTDNIKNR